MARREPCEWSRTEGGGAMCICRSPVYLVRITPRRAQVLGLIADYRTDAEIEDALAIADATAKRHVEDLRVITGCDSKRALARWWVAHRRIWNTLPWKQPQPAQRL